jgi:hypothetical protein
MQGTLTITPSITLQPTTPHISQNPVWTHVHHGIDNPTMHIDSTVGQIMIGRKPSFDRPIPLGGQPPLHIPTGEKPPFVGQTPVVTQSMVGVQPSFTGNPPQSWGPSQGGNFHQPY